MHNNKQIHYLAVLSPCVWGHPDFILSRSGTSGSIPMCMGPPSLDQTLTAQARVYPHVYGATQPNRQLSTMIVGLSPCVWGHRLFNYFFALNLGSIPMCMGPPKITAMKHPLGGVYPHVYGATR